MSSIPLTILPRGNIFQGCRSLGEWGEEQRSQDCEALLRPSTQQWLVWMSAIALWSHWGWREEAGCILHPKDEAKWKWESEQLVVTTILSHICPMLRCSHHIGLDRVGFLGQGLHVHLVIEFVFRAHPAFLQGILHLCSSGLFSPLCLQSSDHPHSYLLWLAKSCWNLEVSSR